MASTSGSIGFFPKPYPEEIMYSVLARWSRHVGQPSPERVSELLLGVVRRRRNILFSSKLGLLASRLPNTSPLTAYTMLIDHTVFPYYATFMKPAARAMVIAQRIGTDEASNSVSSNGWKWLLADNPLRFCSECIVDMWFRYGELYWRRDHHIPTVLVCPEHCCTLLRADISKAGTRGWCAASPETCPDTAPLIVADLTEVERSTLRGIATRSAELLRGKPTILSKCIDPESYQNALVARGLGWGSTFSDPSRLRVELIKHFGYLTRIWPEIFNVTNVTDPVMHILLSMMLDRTPILREAFGPGPWSCPNQLAAHHTEMPVTHVVRTRVSEDPVFGRFYCPCGYVYVCSESRNGKLSVSVRWTPRDYCVTVSGAVSGKTSMFQGSSSATRLTGWSAIQPMTWRR